MNNTEKKAKNADGKRHSRILAGIALLILAAVFAYFAASQPKAESNVKTTADSAVTQQTEATDIPTANETLAAESPATEGTQQTSNAPAEASASSAPTEAPSNALTQAPTTTPDGTEATETKTTTTAVSVQYPLNLNTCTADELMSIDGIGEARASAIIAYREYLGGYTDVEQLKNISGIGDGIFAKLEPYVTV